MTTIGDKFNQLGTAILSLIGTRASRNMDNLSAMGMDNIAAFASGLSQNCISNVCTYVANGKINGNEITAKTTASISTATISGTFKGTIPAGKSTTGNPVNASIDSGEFNDEAINCGETNTNNIELTLFVSSAADGHGVYARRYVASYVKPAADYNTIWYDLNENKLKIYITAVDEESPSWISLGSPSLYSRGTLINGALPLVLKIGRFTLNGTTMSNIIFDKNVQLLDASTVTNSVSEVKVPTGTIIAYMGSNVPNGYIPMDGRYLSTTTYSNLYSVIGDSQTITPRSGYFQIADMTDGRYLMGTTTEEVSNGYTVSAAQPSNDKLTDSGTVYGSNATSGTDTCTYKSSLVGTLCVEKYNNKTGDSTSTYNKITITKGYNPVPGVRVRPVKITFKATAWSGISKGCAIWAHAYNINGEHIGGRSTGGVWTKNEMVTYSIINCPFAYYYAFSALADYTFPDTKKSYSYSATAVIESVVWEVEGSKTRVVGKPYAAGLPTVTGYVNAVVAGGQPADSPLYASDLSGGLVDTGDKGGWGKCGRINLDLSHGSNIYGSDGTVVPESLGTQFMIKY